MNLDQLVKILAPRGVSDYGLKALFLLLFFGASNWLRDFIEHGEEADGLWNNFWEAAFVGILPTLVALALIGHLNKLQISLEKAVITDPLTQLPNRRNFLDQLSAALPDPGGVLMMIDAYHFKSINDTYGHGAGDQCLIKIAELLRAHLRPGDVVARLGGEEFGLLLVAAQLADARRIGERLVGGVALELDTLATPHQVTLSVGAICTTGYRSVAELLSVADTALYEAKAAGRACMVISQQRSAAGPPLAIGSREVA